MATSFTWPPTLPQIVQKGYSETIGMNIMRSPMDSGPAKIRVIGKKPTILRVSFLLTNAQVSILETFVLSTLKGVGRFTFPHPRTDQLVEVRILPQDSDYYSINYLAPGYYTVALTLELLP